MFETLCRHQLTEPSPSFPRQAGRRECTTSTVTWQPKECTRYKEKGTNSSQRTRDKSTISTRGKWKITIRDLGKKTSSNRKGGPTTEQVALLWNLHPWSDSRIAWERPQQPQLTSKLHLQRRKLCRDWLGPDNFPSQPNLFHDLISLSSPRSGFQNLGTEKGRLCCGKGRHLFCHRPQKKGIGWAREKQLQQHTQNSFSFLMLALCCTPLEKDWNHKLHHSNFTSSNSIFLESATTCSVSHGPAYKLKNLYSWRSRNIQDLSYSTHNPSQWR